MNMERYPFEPLDALTDERVPFMPCFFGAISEIPVEDHQGIPGMSDDEYEAFIQSQAGAHNER